MSSGEDTDHLQIQEDLDKEFEYAINALKVLINEALEAEDNEKLAETIELIEKDMKIIKDIYFETRDHLHAGILAAVALSEEKEIEKMGREQKYKH